MKSALGLSIAVAALAAASTALANPNRVEEITSNPNPDAISPIESNPLVFTNDTGGKARAYGQVHPVYVAFDDGEKNYGSVADNSHSNTRVGLFIDQDYGGGQLLRFNFESALGAPASSAVSQDVDPIWEWDKTKLRKIELLYKGAWGGFWVGQGQMASEGASSPSLSRNTIVSSRAVGDTAGGYFFRLKDGSLSDKTIKATHRKWDGARRMRIRYDTPRYFGTKEDKGLYFSAAYGYEALKEDDNTYYDVSARYDDTRGDWDMRASIAYGWIDAKEDANDQQYWSGSLTALHVPTGLNGTLSGGADATNNGSFAYFKLGWIAKFTDDGYTAMSVDTYSGKDTINNGDEAGKWGVQLLHHFDSINLDAFIGYDSYNFKDKSDNSYQDASAVITGVFWKF